MKINLRTIQQVVNIGTKLYREWDRYQTKKNRETQRDTRKQNQQGTSTRRTPTGSTQPTGTREGNYGTFGNGNQSSQPTYGGSTTPPTNNPYAKTSPTSGNPYATGSETAATGDNTTWETGGYPGDYFGSVSFAYSPAEDGEADPGEVVWAWVPYEEDYTQGKDRPVLIIGHDGPYLLGLMLTSKDRNNSHATDPNYLDIGSGVWDKEGRDSEVKLDRVIRIKPRGIRREGAIMPRSTFDYIAQAYNQR